MTVLERDEMEVIVRCLPEMTEQLERIANILEKEKNNEQQKNESITGSRGKH